MWGGGFWGTHREEQWRRRKEKEHEREDQIRRQEQGVQQNLRNQFEHDLQSKDNVLKLTKNLLSVSRMREEMIRAYVGREMTGGLPGPSAVRNEGEAAGQIAHLRQRNCDKMIDLLTKVNGKVQEDQMQNDLDSLSIDWLEILSNFFKKSTQLEQSACAVNHRDLMITYRCTSCRETIGHAANVVGFVMGIRKHPTTKKHACFAAIGLSGGARMALEKAKTHPLGVNAILTGLSTEIVDSLAAAST